MGPRKTRRQREHPKPRRWQGEQNRNTLETLRQQNCMGSGPRGGGHPPEPTGSADGRWEGDSAWRSRWGRPGRRLHARPPWVNSSSCALLMWVLFCARTGPQQRRLATCTGGSPSRASSGAAASSDSPDGRSPEDSSGRPGMPARRVLDAPRPQATASPAPDLD